MTTTRTHISIPIDTETFVALVHFLDGHGSKKDPVDVVAEAIDYWMDNADWKPEFFEKANAGQGYRWKTLFLPDGTRIRMKYKGAYHYASVVADSFVADGKATSPSRFANNLTGTARNAWRDLEVLRPTARKWVMADSLRGENK